MVNISFQIKALESAILLPYLNMKESALWGHNAIWMIADADPGYPCRVSLQDASIGERVLLLPYNHLDVCSPYRATGPIIIREQAKTAKLAINQVPKMLRHRQLSLRGYDEHGMMVATDLVTGKNLEPAIIKLFQ